MAQSDYSRSLEHDLKTKEDRSFSAVLTYARDDSGTVNFTGKTIKLDIYKGSSLVDTLTSATEISIATDALTITKIFTDLVVRAYDYKLYNDTDKIGISHGKFIVI